MFYKLAYLKRKIPLIMVIAAIMTVFLVGGVIDTWADGSITVACAASPDAFNGQGFSFSGQGFSFSGQGFSFSGQGFSFSGQGFSLDTVGLDATTVANEIRNNPVTTGWLANLLPEIGGGVGFNSTKTAILVVDDAAHGAKVNRVFSDLSTVLDMSNVLLVSLDIGAAGVNYEMDAISDLIQAKIDELKAQGYKHFVINMSFGLLPCEDATTGFDFHEFVEARDEALVPQPVTNFFECVVNNYDGTYTAHFGYDNPNANPITVPYGSDNFLTGGGLSASVIEVRTPTYFGRPNLISGSPGRSGLYPRTAFQVVFNGQSLTWTLFGRAQTASKWSTPCHPTPPTVTKLVQPLLECVADNGNGTFTAHFGFNNLNSTKVRVPFGIKNALTGGGLSSTQLKAMTPIHFSKPEIIPGQPGRSDNFPNSAFQVKFNGTNLTWTLFGVAVTASSTSPACLSPVGYGLSQYLTENLGVPESSVTSTMQNLANQVDDEDALEDLRGLLREYLEQSATSNGAFTVVPIASSGNFRPWLGAPPLAPARWPETVAVGATLGDNGPRWQFSQDANVMAPGAGYPLSATDFIAGTSFSAPYVSMILAQWGTYPNACVFPRVGGFARPPLVNPDLLNNATFALAAASPLTCTRNQAPTITPLEARTDAEGTTVSIPVSASDPDNNTLTYSATGLPTGITINSATGVISGTLGFDTANTYNVTVTVTDNGNSPGTASTDFVWTVTDTPQTAICYAQSVHIYSPGKLKNGKPLPLDHKDSSKALGAPQNDSTLNFVSLGFGNKFTSGLLKVDFWPNVILNQNGTAPDIRVWETTPGDANKPWSKSPEAVRVEASQNGIHWVVLGQTTDKDQAYDLGSLASARYIRLIDITNPIKFLFVPDEDGFDVDAIEAFDCGASGTPSGEILTNQTPIANAGADVTVMDDNGDNMAFVQLDGSGSSDSDGTIISYDWMVNGAVMATGVHPSAQAPVGTYEVTLVVTDDGGAQNIDVVSVTILPMSPNNNLAPNQLPTVVSPGDQINTTGDSVSLAINATDPEGSALQFILNGVLPTGLSMDAAGVISGTIASDAAVNSPYPLTITVADATGAAVNISFQWIVTTPPVVTVPNQLPTANAGADQTLSVADPSATVAVVLDGAASLDSDGSIATYAWSLPGITIDPVASPTVILGVGVYEAILTVTDNSGATAVDSVIITVNLLPPPNVPPTANAGADQTLSVADPSATAAVVLDGSASLDSDGSIASYVWFLPGVTIDPVASPTVTLGAGVYEAILTVTDSSGATAVDSVIITVQVSSGG